MSLAYSLGLGDTSSKMVRGVNSALISLSLASPKYLPVLQVHKMSQEGHTNLTAYDN